MSYVYITEMNLIFNSINTLFIVKMKLTFKMFQIIGRGMYSSK